MENSEFKFILLCKVETSCIINIYNIFIYIFQSSYRQSKYARVYFAFYNLPIFWLKSAKRKHLIKKTKKNISQKKVL